MIRDNAILVIVPDRISAILAKGEYPDRYYNPGNLFDEVHLLLTNNDRPNLTELQKTVGQAKLYLHNLPFSNKDFLCSLGMGLEGLRRWAQPAVELARKIRPQLVRCHGDRLNSFIAYVIKKELNIPYLVSLHINADEDHSPSIKQKFAKMAFSRGQVLALKNADRVLPVYRSIVPYLEKRKITNYEVAYNVINPGHIRKKTDYSLHSPIKLISVGRHFALKNPENIIKAVQRIPSAELTLIGSGPYQSHLEDVSTRLGLSGRVHFIQTISNDKLVAMLPDFDLFTVHTQQWELSKALIEAMLTGMPIIINNREGPPIPELQGDQVLFVHDTAESYYAGITSLIENSERRSELGQNAFNYAQVFLAPHKTEERIVEIYGETMGVT